MSVLIKGMEMPKSCDDCYIANCPNDIGYTDRGKCSRHINCPIIEVPEPHGRLIDGGALFEEVFKVWGIEYDASDCNTLMRLINDAPTIIPASEEQKQLVT